MFELLDADNIFLYSSYEMFIETTAPYWYPLASVNSAKVSSEVSPSPKIEISSIKPVFMWAIIGIVLSNDSYVIASYSLIVSDISERYLNWSSVNTSEVSSTFKGSFSAYKPLIKFSS